MTRLLRTNSDNPDFLALAQALDRYLAVIDGDEHAFYAQYNKNIFDYAVVAYVNDTPASCGALKLYTPGILEIKRMYTLPEARGKGLASAVLLELEDWARELGFEKCILETGVRQPDAIHLYQKNGYQPIGNFGPYAGVYNSVCFEKKLNL